MNCANWVKRWLGNHHSLVGNGRERRSPFYRPFLEQLEGRALPSTTTIPLPAGGQILNAVLSDQGEVAGTAQITTNMVYVSSYDFAWTPSKGSQVISPAIDLYNGTIFTAAAGAAQGALTTLCINDQGQVADVGAEAGTVTTDPNTGETTWSTTVDIWVWTPSSGTQIIHSQPFTENGDIATYGVGYIPGLIYSESNNGQVLYSDGSGNLYVWNPGPQVTASTANLAANATSLTINGTGFDPKAANDTVAFNNGVTGTVTSATATTLTVTGLTGQVAGSLTATVTSDGDSSGSPVQVATVTPVVTASTATVTADATTLTIDGIGFGTSNTVSLSGGATGTVSSASATQLTVTDVTGLTAGNLTATVTSNSVSSGNPVQVATVTPVITENTADLAANATSLEIDGFGFSTTAANDVVKFNNGATGTVSTATATALTVTNLSGLIAGNLTATVTSNGVSSGTDQVQVANVTPVVTANTANLAANATTLVISGFGFSTTADNNDVTFPGIAAGTVTSATATQLKITGLRNLMAGSLTAIVTSNGVSSGTTGVQVATVTPIVTASTANLAANAASLTIQGIGFFIPSDGDAVTLSGGATGTVIGGTTTQLTVANFTNLTAGKLTAVVSSPGVTSGSPVQVATVIPVVTASSADLAANAATLVINGFGFSTTASNNLVTFSGGATGKVTIATPTQLTVTALSGLTAGKLTAAITSNGVSSGMQVQVGVVTPTITASTANLAGNASSLVINGFGFSTTAANNVVTFSNGATGVVKSATTTKLTVSKLANLTAGPLTAVVTSNGGSSGTPVQVATVTPTITASTAKLLGNAASLVIDGFGFSTTPADNVVTFANGTTGVVTSATPTTLTVTDLTNLTAGSLTAMVTSDGLASGAAVQVATVVPVVTASTANLPADATSLVIDGFGFSTTADNFVVFSDGVTGVVTNATTTQLVVTGLSHLKPGTLTATVTSDGISSTSPVQVATIVAG